MTRRLALALLFATLSLPACAGPAPTPAEWKIKSAAFLAANARTPGVVVLPDGLQYKVTKAGPAGGVSPLANDRVLVNYEARLMDGTVVDSSFQRGQPATFVVGELIPAWTEALQKMKPGDDWMLYAPPLLAYGTDGKGPVPPNSALVFRVQLISVLPRDASVGDG